MQSVSVHGCKVVFQAQSSSSRLDARVCCAESVFQNSHPHAGLGGSDGSLTHTEE